MLTVLSFLTLLSLGIARAESPPEYILCPQYTHECVEFFQCINGVINIFGEGLIDPRIKLPNRTRTTRVRTRVGRMADTSQSSTRSLPCLISSSNTPGTCCQIPGVTTPAPTTLSPLCSGGKVCVDRGQCSAQGNVITDGSGLIDPRRIPDCTILQTGSQGVCCAPPPQIVVIDNCPGNANCVQSSQCTTQALDANNNYAPYTQGGSWTHCRLGGQHSSQTGVCCQKPEPQYTAAAECGVRHTSNPTTRFLNKQGTIFGEFPWQAILFFKNYTFACGATLISQQWAVTAAHCIKGNRRQLLVRLGETVVNEESQPIPTQDIGVRKIIIHPNYNSRNLQNDIALIRLRKSVPYQYHINRVCLPEQNQVVQQGVRCFASGWGKNAFEGQFQVALKKVDLPIVSNTNCQHLLRKTRLGSRFILDHSFICAGGERGKDVCTGDGGGPLVCQDPLTKRYFLYGITSWGIGCGTADVPGVYVNVREFSNWIWDEIQ